MADHTPGPWREGWDYQRVSSDSDRMIAHATGPHHSCVGVRIMADTDILQPDRNTMECVYADARLIAAAPELLAALEAALASLEGQRRVDQSNEDLAAVYQARAAITKAKGI